MDVEVVIHYTSEWPLESLFITLLHELYDSVLTFVISLPTLLYTIRLCARYASATPTLTLTLNPKRNTNPISAATTLALNTQPSL